MNAGLTGETPDSGNAITGCAWGLVLSLPVWAAIWVAIWVAIRTLTN